MRIDVIMQEIYKQGGLKFAFNSQQINPSRKVHITSDLLSIGAILNQVEETAGVKFKVVGRHIVLLHQTKDLKAKGITAGKGNNANAVVKNRSGEKQNVISKKAKPKTSFVSTNKSSADNRLIKAADPGKVTTAIRNTLLASKRIDSVNSYNGEKMPALAWHLTVDTIPTISQPNTPVLLTDGRPEKDRPFWISAGVNGSELSFVNLSVRAGYKKLYGIITLEACSCSPHYRWGIGFEQWQGRSWQFNQTITTGTTAALYPAATLPEVLVKNRHYKWSALLSKRILEKVDIQFGPVINVLHTRYFSNDAEGSQQKIAAGALLPETMDGDKVFTSTKAPYTLFNTYKKERVANWKGWVGAELGIYYRIPFSLRKLAVRKKID